jgi:hypothetical protein
VSTTCLACGATLSGDYLQGFERPSFSGLLKRFPAAHCLSLNTCEVSIRWSVKKNFSSFQ